MRGTLIIKPVQPVKRTRKMVKNEDDDKVISFEFNKIFIEMILVLFIYLHRISVGLVCVLFRNF